MSSRSFFEAQQWAFSFVTKHGLEESGANMLLYGEMGYSVTEFLMHMREPMPPENWCHFKNNIKLYCQGFPPQYLLGKSSFYGLELKVSPAVLIPRQETEELVDWVLATNDHAQKKVADIGTGSGAIGLAIKKYRPKWKVVLTDISAASLKVADENAATLHLDVSLCKGDLLSPLTGGPYDIIISNPPYIDRAEKRMMDRSVLEHEPHLALFAADNGLEIYRKIADQISNYIHRNSKLYVEIGYAQGRAVVGIFKNKFPLAEVILKRDLSGHDRMVQVIFK